MSTTMSKMSDLISACWGFIRYCMIGGASMLAYIGVSNALYFVGLHPTASTIFAWTIAASIAYFGHIHFSYRVQADHRRMVFKFATLLGINFLQTLAVTYLFFDLLGFSYPVTSLIASVSGPLVSYPINKYWVFRVSPETE